MLELIGIKKEYPTPEGPYVVFNNVDLKVRKQEFVSIIGQSGCGKTTLLSLMAGLRKPTEGIITLQGKAIQAPGPDRGVIFQSPALMPWLSAFENVMLGIDRVYTHASKNIRNALARHYLSRVGMGDAMAKKSNELSQGMQQRVGVARAFSLRPRVLLLDEPFGMLDSLSRGKLQDNLIDIWNQDKTTAIMITHDVDEAIFLSDRIVMMTSGPYAEIEEILDVRFERPRKRKDILEQSMYYTYRKVLMDFLKD